jgi:hypothetical protein
LVGAIFGLLAPISYQRGLRAWPLSLNVEVTVRVVDRVSPVSAWRRVSFVTPI